MRSAKDLIRALLTTDPDLRLNATQALSHEWCSQPLTQTPHLNLDKTRLNMHKTVRKKFKVGACSQSFHLSLILMK